MLAGACAAPSALAEKADREKPVNIESDRMNADDARRIATFEGRVVLTQGTLTLRADRITVRQDRDGFQFGTATGKPALFRQKREGANEYMEAEAERIEYDARAERVEFFENARMRRDGGDDVRGNFISYDARTEFFTVNSRPAGGTGDSAMSGPQDRVRAVIQPRGAGGAPAAGEARPPANPDSRRN
ncbi:MAG: lipopolysaccharide transport periplasmic protein LptA [Betaproteobacteria bacterium]|nr:lipopolysaccharide transport periplasmic protein LptA [Betaproteobacteria bacterium]